MKRIHVAWLWAALAFTETTFAQNSPSQFVIGGAGGDENCAIEGLKAVFGNRVLLPVYPQQKD